MSVCTLVRQYKYAEPVKCYLGQLLFSHNYSSVIQNSPSSNKSVLFYCVCLSLVCSVGGEKINQF